MHLFHSIDGSVDSLFTFVVALPSCSVCDKPGNSHQTGLLLKKTTKKLKNIRGRSEVQEEQKQKCK